MQTDLSLSCYRGYLEALRLREAIDEALKAGTAPANAARRKEWGALRGPGVPGDQDILYGSITAVPSEKETVVGLQNKFLFMLNLLQGADARPTSQAEEAVPELRKTLEALGRRWQSLRQPPA